jgi:hypothetical protein
MPAVKERENIKKILIIFNLSSAFFWGVCFAPGVPDRCAVAQAAAFQKLLASQLLHGQARLAHALHLVHRATFNSSFSPQCGLGYPRLCTPVFRTDY